MATQEIPILGMNTAPDSSGDVFFEPLETALTLTTAAFGTLLGLTMEFPTGADIGIFGKFTIPQNYSGSPVLVIRGIVTDVDSVLAFGFQQVSRADNETIEVAFEAEDLAEATPSGHSLEDMYEETITITPTAAYVAGDEVFYFFFRDEDQDDSTGDFILTGLFLQYADA